MLETDENWLFSFNDLQRGWHFTGRLRDVSDIEWSSWKYFFYTSWYFMLCQFLISEILYIICSSFLKYWFILSSTIFVIVYMGYKQMLIIFVQPLMYVLILLCGGRKLSIWISSILLLLSYNSLKYKYYFWNFLDHKDMQDEEVYLILFSVAWIELRCISYSLDFIERKENNLTWPDVVNLFSYVLYLPLLYTGPVILYEEFEKSFTSKRKKIVPRLKRFAIDMAFFQLYTFLLDLAFHYIYFFAMQNNMQVCMFII